MAGGTQEAPSWLTPAATPVTLPLVPVGGWPHKQDNYGGVNVGGSVALPGPAIPHLTNQNYGAVIPGSGVLDPTTC